MRKFQIALVLFSILLFSSTSFGAENEEAITPSEQAISQLTQEVSNEVLSPFCPGKTLAMCPSPAAAEARRTIQELAKQGLSKEQITAKLIDQYGPEFKRVTPGLGDNIVVLILVLVGLLLCSAFVWFLSFRGRNVDSSSDSSNDDNFSGHSPNTPPTSNLSHETDTSDPDDYLEQIRQEYKD